MATDIQSFGLGGILEPAVVSNHVRAPELLKLKTSYLAQAECARFVGIEEQDQS